MVDRQYSKTVTWESNKCKMEKPISFIYPYNRKHCFATNLCGVHLQPTRTMEHICTSFSEIHRFPIPSGDPFGDHWDACFVLWQLQQCLLIRLCCQRLSSVCACPMLCYGCGWMCYFFFSLILLNKYITAERQTILSVTECAVVILPWRENIHPTFSISALNTHDTFKLIFFTGICISFAVIFILYWIFTFVPRFFCSLHRVCYFFSILLPFFLVGSPLFFFVLSYLRESVSSSMWTIWQNNTRCFIDRICNR